MSAGAAGLTLGARRAVPSLDPNGGGLPAWPRYTPPNGETMVLDDVSEVRNDPDRQARKALPPL